MRRRRTALSQRGTGFRRSPRMCALITRTARNDDNVISIMLMQKYAPATSFPHHHHHTLMATINTQGYEQFKIVSSIFIVFPLHHFAGQMKLNPTRSLLSRSKIQAICTNTNKNTDETDMGTRLQRAYTNSTTLLTRAQQ